ncbi:hypothetical protein [Halomonas sp. H5]|uniref:hypothetical protein n=1 Tax=Halomonas sp. H5 TaxID=3423910 RepID=UPI003D3665A3
MKITTQFAVSHDTQGASHGLWRLHYANRPEVTLSYHRGREAAHLAQLRLEALPESLIELICNKAAKLGLEQRLRLAHEVGHVLETWPAADLEHELRLLAFNHCAILVDAAEAALQLLDQRRQA